MDSITSRSGRLVTSQKRLRLRGGFAIGVVVIGRNEGDRLRRCLDSVSEVAERIVYVDSGSSDGSVALAEGRGIDAVMLDGTTRFTAARARNAGFVRMMTLWPDIEMIQFIDGDCELDGGWIDAAARALAEAPRVAVVCGRRRERHAHATIYNRVCDIEWDAPAGETESCGGDALMRVDAFREMRGFTEDLIAGEEPDLCHRLRRGGWKIQRLPIEMTLHDLAMTGVGQWWQRNRRSGHAGAEAWHRRGREDRRLLKPLLSNLLWGLPPFWLLWPLLWWRVFRRHGALYATHITIGKLPHCAGQIGFWWANLRSRRTGIIEYK